MIYLAEDYYFKNNKNFPSKKAILITAWEVSLECQYYEAIILAPKRGIKEKVRQGLLPKSSDEKKEFIQQLLNWIWDNSVVNTYRLVLSNEKEKNKIVNQKYGQYDGTDCCWMLDLSKKEFFELQKTWKNNALPQDIFYPEDKEVVTIPEYYKKWSTLRRILLGGTYSFSPKKWEEMKKEGEDKKYIIQKPE